MAEGTTGVKVVLFCGGQGFQVPGQTETVPKPMTMIGYRPILWHVMRCYAHHGLNEFVLCLGYRSETVKNYFLRYNEALSNDFILTRGGLEIEMLSTDIGDWGVTFVDTGLHSNICQRLLSVRHHLQGESIFCANYADCVTDAPLLDLVHDFRAANKIAAVLSVRPSYSFHVVTHQPDGLVTGMTDSRGADLWVNGGFFMFREAIFDFIQPGEELTEEPFRRLIAAGELITYRYEGFWAALDTLKDLENLQTLEANGSAPWAPWLASPGVG
jgi:glucose-1-phosphate cytidylyltransferase